MGVGRVAANERHPQRTEGNDPGTSTSAEAYDPRLLTVEELLIDGYSVPEMATRMKVCPRTIRRWLKRIRERNAAQIVEATVAELVGGLVWAASTAVRRIRRAAGGKGASVADKIQAESSCWRVSKELTELLQRLGHLPTAPVEIRGKLRHDVAVEVPTYSQMQAEVDRLMQIVRERGEDAHTLCRVVELRETVARAAVSERLAVLTGDLAGEGFDDGDE